MKPTLRFVKGEFVTYRALTKVHLGKLGTDVWEGDEIEFDGSTVRYAGEEHSLGTLRGAIEAGWFAHVDDNVSKYVPKREKIQLHEAKHCDNKVLIDADFVEISEEEREVGSWTKPNAKTKAAEQSSTNRHTAKSAESEDVKMLKEQLAQMQAMMMTMMGAMGKTANSAKKAPVQVDDDEEDAEVEGDDEVEFEDDSEGIDSNGQEYTTVARIKTPTSGTIRMDDPRSVQKARDRDHNTVTRAEVVRKPLGKQASAVRLSVYAATGDVQEAVEGENLEDMMPNVVSSKKPLSKVTSSEEQAPTDVNAVFFITTSTGVKMPWNKRSHWKSRIRTAIERFGDDPKTLRAIAAIEDPGVKKEILAHLGK